MLTLVNFLRGSVEVEIESVFPERIINLCSQNDIPFWGLRWMSATRLRMKLERRHYRKLCARAKRLSCTITVVGRKGVPFFLGRFKKRYALIAGLLLFLMLIPGSLFIWDIQVSGNKTVTDREILEELKKLGVGIGTFGPSIDPETIKHHALLDIGELSWITVNVSGSRAYVLVRERTEPPEIVDESIPANLVAAKTGVITRMEVYNGSPQFKAGQTVLAGELLVSGVVDTPTVGVRFLHAEGKVYARTWYELSAETPLAAEEKAYTGRETTRLTLVLWGRRINLYLDGGISFADYDKIRSDRKIRLPSGMTLPVSLSAETYREYEPVIVQEERQAAEERLKQALLLQLRLKLDQGEVLNTRFDIGEQDGVLKVTLTGECEEQIAKTTEIPEENLKQ